MALHWGTAVLSSSLGYRHHRNGFLHPAWRRCADTSSRPPKTEMPNSLADRPSNLGAATRAPNDRSGSKPEKLDASLCFPLCTLKPDIAEYGRHVRLVPEAGHWTGFEARARQAAISLITIHVIQHAAAVLSVTSTRVEGEAGALLQTLAQRRTHQRAWRPGAALALHVAHNAECALGDHLAGRAVARIAVARDYRLDPSAVRQLAQEEDVVEALLALFPSRACAGFETAGRDQGNHCGERLCRNASEFSKSGCDH